jgi:hypothetical protein
VLGWSDRGDCEVWAKAERNMGSVRAKRERLLARMGRGPMELINYIAFLIPSSQKKSLLFLSSSSFSVSKGTDDAVPFPSWTAGMEECTISICQRGRLTEDNGILMKSWKKVRYESDWIFR